MDLGRGQVHPAGDLRQLTGWLVNRITVFLKRKEMDVYNTVIGSVFICIERGVLF